MTTEDRQYYDQEIERLEKLIKQLEDQLQSLRATVEYGRPSAPSVRPWPGYNPGNPPNYKLLK